MKLNQPIINSEIEISKKEYPNQSQNRYPEKPTHQSSNSLSEGVNKVKQTSSRSFHQQNLLTPQSQFSIQKTQSGDKNNYTSFQAQKSANPVYVTGFTDLLQNTNVNDQNESTVGINNEFMTNNAVKAQQYNAGQYFEQKEIQNQIGSNNSIQDSNDTFKVYTRIRPMNAKEKSQQNTKKRSEIIKTYQNTIYIQDPETTRIVSDNQKEKNFTFDMVFGERDDNQYLYQGTVASLLQNHLLEGYNTTVFAYGQTGAGKSYTLFGDEYKNLESLEGKDYIAQGIVTLIINDLFRIFEKNQDFKYKIKVSYLEIYNENIRDLLVEQQNQSNLMIVEDPQKGIIIPELTEYQIQDGFELNNLIRKGNNIRVMASTQSNQFSSRSHCIIQINIEKSRTDEKYNSQKIISKLSLIDLAGSERAAVSDNRGIRMMEGSKINRSLLALGNCINILSDSKKQGAYVPYRDSKLTRLLKDSLGGTTKTVMIACIGPSSITYEETINTLKYAQRAKNIQNKIKQNIVDVDIHVSQYKEIIDALKLEIDSLKRQLQTQSNKEFQFSSKKRVQSDNIDDLDENSEQNKDQNGQNSEIEDLQGQIFINIEENWEINQTLKDLESLRNKNQEMLLKKQEEYNLLSKTTMNEKIEEEITQLSQEIQTIEQNMQNNDNVYLELQGNLEKNNTEKKNLRDKIRQIVESSDNGQEKTLEDTCRILQLEKMDLCSQNIEIKKEAQTLAREKEKTVNMLKQMEKEMQQMKMQLQEKDQIISKSSVIINQLKQKEQLQSQQQKQKKTNQNISQNLLSPQFQSATASSTRKVREKSATQANQDSKNVSMQGQTNFRTTDKSPIYQAQSPQFQDMYYRPKQQNRQISTSIHQDSQKNKKLNSNFSQQSAQQRNLNSSSNQIINPGNSKEKQISSKQFKGDNQVNTSIHNTNDNQSNSNNKNNFNNNSIMGFMTAKQSSTYAGNQQFDDVKKEYYYFDSNKKLQRRNEQGENKASMQNDQNQMRTERDNHLQKQELIDKQNDKISSQHLISDQTNSQYKQNKGLFIDQESLKKFEEIQKQKSDKKVQEHQNKISGQNNQQDDIKVHKPKQKKKNKHKNNQILDKINIDDLKHYAEKLKDMDFDNVKIKANLKKFQKNTDNQTNNMQTIKQTQINKDSKLKKQDSQNNLNDKQQYITSSNTHSSQKIEQIKEYAILQNQEYNIYQNMYDNGDTYNKDVNMDIYKNNKGQNVQQANSIKSTIDAIKQDIQNNKQGQGQGQGQGYEQEINNIQRKIEETQQLISSCLKTQNYKQKSNHEAQEVTNNQQMQDEKVNSNRNIQQKQAYYQKIGNNKNKEINSDGNDFENYIMNNEKATNNDGGNQDQNELVPINDISCMNKVADNSVDQTLQDFVYNFEKAENQNNNQAHFHLVLDQKYNSKQPQSTQQKQNLQSTPDQSNKLNLKSLDEARIKMRAFKHQLTNLNEKVKSSQINPDIIDQMKGVLQQYEKEQYTLSIADENIIKEFKRILVILKEYNNNTKSSSNNYNSSSTSASKNTSNILSSANPSSVNYATNGPSNQNFQYSTRPRCINSVIEEPSLQNQYYQQNNFSKRETSQQIGHSNQNNYQSTQNNISVGRKQIEQGAFSKILNNYGEASKVINQPQQQSNSANLKKYSKNILPQGEIIDSSRKIPKQSPNYDHSNNRLVSDLGPQNYQNYTALLNNAQQQFNANEIQDQILKNNENFTKVNQSNNNAQGSFSSQNFNNVISSSTTRGKSATSYVQINNKRKSFKEDNDKSFNNNNNPIRLEQQKQIQPNLLNQLDQNPENEQEM